MKYILKYTFYVYEGYVAVPRKKNLLFHNPEGLSNYIRTEVDATTLIKLEVERLTVE